MSANSGDLRRRVGLFFSLTPERVLDAVEEQGGLTTGLCYALNSLENRVYEVEIEDSSRIVGKFYRPDRWSRETILDEHALLAALHEAEIPVCPPLPFSDGSTLHRTQEGIFFALFPRTGGRAVEELDTSGYTQLGRLIGRIHNVSASLSLPHRHEISPRTYGRQCLDTILERTTITEGLKVRYVDAVERLIDIGTRRFEGKETFVVHGDCHRGNLLSGPGGWFFLDFDDSGTSPPVQDIWLLLPARRADCPREIEAMIEGYEEFRSFDHSSLALIEVLRALRYVRYAAWVAARWDDPAFPRAFPQWGTENYWQGQLVDLHEQLAILEAEDGHVSW
ncbi:MAG: serine/threonine protein kinase [Deltaproteobacteria bacterium]|nr:serine/threonine protein kinase [Deltaproteobacteria bacterium]